MAWPPLPGWKRKQINSREQELEGFQQARILQQVVVIANKEQKIYGTSGANACGDYVCIFNILNCPSHFGDRSNSPPVKGKYYNMISPSRFDVNEGCSIEENRKRLKGIYLAREFYGVNTDTLFINEPQFLSTLYWEPASLINEDGEKTISFYTGDITGKFRVIVQGFSIKDLIATETKFLVK